MELARRLSAYLGRLQRPPSADGAANVSLLRDAREKYPRVFALATDCSQQLQAFLGREPREAELGDVALCLIAALERLRHTDRWARRALIVCGEGAVTAWLLESRLRSEFPDVEIAGVISALEFERRDSEGIDFIVSTIALRARHVPVIQVSALLTAQDCQRLRSAFERRPPESLGRRMPATTTPHLSSLLTDHRIQLGLSAASWPEVVERAGHCLLHEGAIDRGFIAAMKDVIYENGPYMVIWPGAVLLHARPRGVRQLSMSLVNLRNPVRFGHTEHDPVSIAIVLAAVDGQSHITALQELNNLMQDAAARSAIARTLQKSVVLHWIARYSA
jgi:mannitol operon transcriptional antiterminator